MIDQLIIGGVASFDDYEASLKERKAPAPKKKSIKETVPFSNTTYDFSGINGEVYWEDRELEYSFEITADTPEELEQKRMAFSSWVMNVSAENIYDPFVPDYHYRGTFEDISYDDDESLEKTTITVKFSAYPYKIANDAKAYTVGVMVDGESEVAVINNSSHPVTPTITTTGATVIIDGETYTLSAGTYTDSKIKLAVGATTIVCTSTGTSITNISFNEEVF